MQFYNTFNSFYSKMIKKQYTFYLIEFIPFYLNPV